MLYLATSVWLFCVCYVSHAASAATAPTSVSLAVALRQKKGAEVSEAAIARAILLPSTPDWVPYNDNTYRYRDIVFSENALSISWPLKSPKYTQFRLQGIRIYDISGYMDHFFLVLNGMDFHRIRFFGYKEWIINGIFWGYWGRNSSLKGCK